MIEVNFFPNALLRFELWKMYCSQKLHTTPMISKIFKKVKKKKMS